VQAFDPARVFSAGWDSEFVDNPDVAEEVVAVSHRLSVRFGNVICAIEVAKTVVYRAIRGGRHTLGYIRTLLIEANLPLATNRPAAADG
jgi:hypothetical protein